MFLRIILLQFVLFSVSSFAEGYFGNGIKIGELTSDSAVIWVRLTTVKGDASSAEKSAPPFAGSFEISLKSSSSQAMVSTHTTDIENDACVSIPYKGLKPGTEYTVTVKTKVDELNGSFTTAPAEDSISEVSGVVVTGQRIDTADDPKKGHFIYSELSKLRPGFFVHTGDVVYYDKGGIQPLSTSVDLARKRWNRIFSFEWNKNFHSTTPVYYIKDDHDTLKNDCWPGQTYGDLTFDQGVKIFNEQTPQSEKPYKTVSWGKDLQIWILECREYRSANTAKDGPNKTILGKEQKDWLVKTLGDSKASFKLVISPIPLIGPDKNSSKSDNWANKQFATESKWLKETLAAIPNLYFLCGDRHWQYVSKDPATGLYEYCSGPVSLKHATGGGGSKGAKANDKYHQFFAVRGGFLYFKVSREDNKPVLTFKYFDSEKKANGRLQETYSKTHTYIESK